MSSSRPKSARSKPAWDDTRSDLSIHRATPSELARRRESMRSKHAAEARRELLARDRTRPLGEDEIEAELGRLQALRAALYDQREHETRVQHTHQTLSQADRKIEQVSGLPSQRRDQIEMEGSVRMKGHIEMTSPPSDLSSIDGNEEERTCHTPNSMASSSDENKKQQTKQVDMSHAEASDNLRLVEQALDKVVPGENESGSGNFTGRLIGTITRTVKYVADCEKRLVEEGTARVQLEKKVNEQQQLINALSHELMKFESSQNSLLAKFDALAKRFETPKTDVTEDMTQLVKSLRQPGALDELKATTPKTSTLDIDLDALTGGVGESLADMVDALGDKMAEQ